MPDTIATLKRGERFTVPALPNVPVLTFGHLDGMCSRSETEDGQICWLAAWTPVVREVYSEVSPVYGGRERRDG